MDTMVAGALRELLPVIDSAGHLAVWAAIVYILVKFGAPLVFYGVLARSVVTCVRIVAETSLARRKMEIEHAYDKGEIRV